MNNIDIKKFNILYDNIFVEGIELEEKSGIVTSNAYEDKPELGKVLSVGAGRLLDSGIIKSLTVKVGDVIYFNKYSTTKFNFDGKDYFVVREEDVVGFIRD